MAIYDIMVKYDLVDICLSGTDLSLIFILFLFINQKDAQ